MKHIIHSFLAFFMCTSALLAQWEKCRCYHNDNVMEFIRTDSVLYAITDSYVMKSGDNGITWDNVTNNRFRESITSIAYTSDTLYLGTKKGMYSSGNKGNTWKETELNGSWIQSIITRADTLLVYAYERFYKIVPGHLAEELPISDGVPMFDCTINENTVFVGSVGCVYRSTDNGKNWVVKNSGLPQVNIERITANGINVFAIGSDNVVYKSTDNGDNWTKVEINNHNPKLKIIFTKHRCYIVTVLDLLYSEDMGISWQKYDTLESEYNYPCAIWEEENLTLIGKSYRGVFRSTDDGLTWLKTGAECGKFYDLDVIDTIIYGYAERIYTSKDSAKTWNMIDVDGKVYGDAHVLFARNVYSNSFKRSYDKGKRWEDISLPDVGMNITYWAFADSVLYICTKNGVVASYDYGNTWIKSLEKDTTTNSITFSENIVTVQFSDGQVYYTTDKGKQWHFVKMLFSEKLTFFTIMNGVFIASFGYGMQKSTNRGMTWESFSFVYLNGINAIETEGGFLLISGERLLISDTTGSDVRTLKNFGEQVIDMARNGNDLYVCTEKGNVWKTNLSHFLTEINEQSYFQNSTKINIFPNPASSAITVQMQTDMPYTYIIINQLGETVQAGTVEENGFSHQVSVSTLSSGAYTFITRTNGIIHKQMFSVIK